MKMYIHIPSTNLNTGETRHEVVETATGKVVAWFTKDFAAKYEAAWLNVYGR